MSTVLTEPAGSPGAVPAGPPSAATRRAAAEESGAVLWAARRRADGVTGLTVALAALYLVPARLVFAPLGAAGRPAGLIGLALLAWWSLSRLVPDLAQRGRQPIRTVALVWLYVYLVAYTLGYARGLPGIESLSSDRALLATLALVGFTLMAADGVPDRSRLDTLLTRMTVLGAVVALLGELQFLFGLDLVGAIRIPGLSLNAELIGIANRGEADLRRVASTAAHYIEFGVIMALLLPLAIHYALYAKTRSERQWRWVVAAVIGAAVPFSISRSGFLCLVVAMVVLALIWNLRMQLQGLIVGLVALMGLRFLVPGLLGTIMSLFQNLENDPSVQNRESDYPIVFRYVAERPWFGRGPGTFMPDRYVLLDNEVLGTLVSTGYIGLAALLAVFVVSFATARAVAKRTAQPENRHLAQALAASMVGALVASFTFDSLSFATFAGTLFVLAGCIGALWRLDRTDRTPIPPRPGHEILKPNRVRAGRLRRRDRPVVAHP